MYKFLLIVHRWFGITVGLFFVLLGLSGSYLVYKDTFQAWAAPGLRQSSGAPGTVNLSAAALAAQKGLDLELQPTGVRWSDNANRNLEFIFTGIPGMGHASIVAFVDPITAQFKGKEVFKDTVTGTIFFFHHDIFLGGTGRIIMAISGIAMLVILIGGLYLWWPRKKTWRRVLKLGPMNNPLQANLELHKFFGFYTLLLMVMVTFSGVYISKPNWFQTVKPRGGGEQDDRPLPTVDFEKLGVFLAEQPKPLLARIDARKSTLQLEVHSAEQQWFALESFEKTEAPPKKPKDMRGIQRDLHGGQFWSELGKFLVFVSGLLPLFFYISGIYIWWKKSKRRRTA